MDAILSYNTVEQADDEIARLEQRVLRLKRCRNTLVPIGRLPPEILSEIFQAYNLLGHMSDDNDPWWLFAICHTCSTWRSTALHCAALLDTVDLDWPAPLVAWILSVRRDEAPLRIVKYSEAPPADVSAEILKRVHLVVEIDILLIDHLHMNAFLVAMASSLVSSLASLTIYCTMHSAPYMEYLMALFFSVPRPRLRSLVLDGADMACFSLRPLGHLQKLILKDCYLQNMCNTTNDLLSIINDLYPNLVTLHIIQPKSLPVETDSRRIEFQHLDHLRLEMRRYRHATQLIPALGLKSSCTVQLHLFEEHPSKGGVDAFVSAYSDFQTRRPHAPAPASSPSKQRWSYIIQCAEVVNLFTPKRSFRDFHDAMENIDEQLIQSGCLLGHCTPDFPLAFGAAAAILPVTCPDGVFALVFSSTDTGATIPPLYLGISRCSGLRSVTLFLHGEDESRLDTGMGHRKDKLPSANGMGEVEHLFRALMPSGHLVPCPILKTVTIGNLSPAANELVRTSEIIANCLQKRRELGVPLTEFVSMLGTEFVSMLDSECMSSL